MRSFIGAYINRETEQCLLNVITSFLIYQSIRIRGAQNRLLIFVRKNRTLGRIYIENVVDGLVKAKCYYSQLHWILEHEDSKQYLIIQMERLYRNARSIGLLLDESTNMIRVLNSNTILVFRLPHQ